MKKSIYIVGFIVMRIVLNVFLPSVDTYSDVALAYKTFTFNLGESLLLSGCRVCQGKDETDIYTLNNKSCQLCLTTSDFNRACGLNHEILNIMNEHERKDTCDNEPLSVTLNYNETTNSNSIKNENCDSSKHILCCVEKINSRNISSVVGVFDKTFMAFPTSLLGHQMSKMIYNTYILTGKLSELHCQTVFLDYFTSTIETFYAYVNNNITALKSSGKTELYLKFTNAKDGKVSLENGFSNEDGCGLLLQTKQYSHITQENIRVCGIDSCLEHIQSLRHKLNITSFDDWKYNTFYASGIKFGGRTCHLLWTYGLAIIVPTFFNMAFNAFVFFDDLRNGIFIFEVKIEITS